MREQQADVIEIDYGKKTKLDAATVESIVDKAGGVAAVLNTRHATAKAKGWVDTPPSKSVFAKAVVAEVNLLKRPIVVAGNKVIVGFDAKAYAGLPKKKS